MSINRKELWTRLFLQTGSLAVIWAVADSGVLAQTSQDFVYSRQVNSDPHLLLQQGTALLRSNHNEEAAVKFERLCAINPDSAKGHYQWGLALLKLGRTSEGSDQLKQAIRLDPRLADAWLTLAGVYQATGDTDQAISTYSEFVRRFPQDNDAQRAGGLLALLSRQRSANYSQTDVPATSSNASANSNNAMVTPAIGTAAQPMASQADYYQEVTRHGLIRWAAQQMPLRVFIDENCSLEAYNKVYAAILKAAFLEWASRSQGLIGINFARQRAQADIICTWTDNISKFSAEGEPAETRLYGGQSGLARGEIEILVISPSSKQALTEDQMNGVALHEVGHVLGLAGHSNSRGDIMFFSPYNTSDWRDISVRDETTLVRLYSTK